MKKRTLYTFCSISGAGKSTIANTFLHDEEGLPPKVISMDAWRKKLTGNVSDQSQNALVAQKADAELLTALRTGEQDVVWDATNLRISYIKKLHTLALEHGYDFVVMVLSRSENPQACSDAVAEDLKQGVCRSDTVSDKSIIDSQHKKWLNTVKLLGEYASQEKGITVLRV